MYIIACNSQIKVYMKNYRATVQNLSTKITLGMEFPGSK